jgi:hypothetical protein
MSHEIANQIGIVSINCNFHARKLAEKVFQDPTCYFKPWEYGEILWGENPRIPYLLGFYSNGRKVIEAHYNMIDLYPQDFILEQRPALVHWLGTDIVHAIENKIHGEKRMFEKLSHPNIVNLVHLQEHKDELLEVMPHAHFEIVPLPPYVMYEPEPFEDPLVVSVYMPNLRTDFYRMETIVNAAAKFPETRFEFYYYYDEHEELIRGTTNCYRVPRRDEQGMKDQIRRSKLFIRIPVHDGLSVQALEFATAGRSVIYNKNLPFMDYCETTGEMSSDVPRLASLIEKALARTEPNQEMAKFYREEYGHEKYLSRIAEIVGWFDEWQAPAREHRAVV